MLRAALAICLLLISSLGTPIAGLAAQIRNVEPAFLSQSDEDLTTKYKGLKKGQLLPQSLQFASTKYNDEIWYNDKFGKTSQYLRQYPIITDWDAMVDQFENPFGGNHPMYKAGRLPGIENNPIVSSYIASRSPAYYGKGTTTLYWDMVWMKAKDNALIVNLLEPNSGYTLHDDEPLPATKDDALRVYEIDETTGEMTCNVKYTVNLVDTTSLHDGLILFSKISLVQEGTRKSKTFNFIHYTSWKNRRSISNENMRRLIELANEKQTAGYTMFVNCLYGLGRTGTFIIAREIYNVAQKAKKSGKNWFTQKGANGADPIEQYVNTLRITRSETIDSARQYLFLYKWAEYVQQQLHS